MAASGASQASEDGPATDKQPSQADHCADARPEGRAVDSIEQAQPSLVWMQSVPGHFAAIPCFAYQGSDSKFHKTGLQRVKTP
jgi:hypothetical protein